GFHVTGVQTCALPIFAHRIAPYIEARRVPRDEAVACSYRIDLTESGDFFGTDGNGYQLFASRSRELAEAYEWALSFDISNFYNRSEERRGGKRWRRMR